MFCPFSEAQNKYGKSETEEFNLSVSMTADDKFGFNNNNINKTLLSTEKSAAIRKSKHKSGSDNFFF